MIRHASLFSGIGGFDLAAQAMGWQNVFAVEKDPYCQKVLTKNFPTTALYGDIKGFYGDLYRGSIDILSGGFPCQPFSVAGQRKGKNDDRYLWDEMLRVIAEVRPRVVVGENVTGIINMALDTVCIDLENQGYEVETFVLPACAIGAPHQRNRVWIVAHSLRSRCDATEEKWRRAISDQHRHDTPTQQSGQLLQCRACQSSNIRRLGGADAYAYGFGQLQPKGLKQVLGRRAGDLCQKTSYNGITAYANRLRSAARVKGSGAKHANENGGAWRIDRSQWHAEPAVGRVAYGIPHRLDRIKALGNAVVPQLVYQIFKALETSQLLL
jgi:DNA (cytosine-5)-methyltransferase 1